MLNVLGQHGKDERIIGLTDEFRTMVQQRKFDTLSKDNVPFPGMENFNLLKTHDLSQIDKNKLVKAGLGDMLHHPTAEIMSSSIIKNKLDLNLEQNDFY